MSEAYRTSSVDWKPSPLVALATSVDDSQVAAARQDGSLEIWLVSPGSVGWHCQLTIHGDPESRVSTLIWCRAGSKGLPCGRLFSSSINGSVLQWDLFHLKQKTVLDSIGVSIWQMAVAPCSGDIESKDYPIGNGCLKANRTEGGDPETSDSENDSDSTEINEQSIVENQLVALACDDGCVRIYSITKTDEFVYTRSLPRVSGRVLSVTWSPDTKFIYSGSSDGMIRCWDAKLGHEIYRITVGLGGLGSGPELCVWSLLSLRCGNLVSADSTGSVQFWDSQHGTLLQAHSYHKGDVNALAAAPSHNRVFSAGSDGQVILYKLSSATVGSSDDKSSSEVLKKWIYVGRVKAHTHDVRALTVAVPISREDPLPDEGIKIHRKERRKITPNNINEFSYRKWAHLGVPMLISAGDDTKLIAYPVKEFTQFKPHDICPAPQRLPIQLVLNRTSKQSLLLVQASSWVDILLVRAQSGTFSKIAPVSKWGQASTDLLVRVKSKAYRNLNSAAVRVCASLEKRRLNTRLKERRNRLNQALSLSLSLSISLPQLRLLLRTQSKPKVNIMEFHLNHSTNSPTSSASSTTTAIAPNPNPNPDSTSNSVSADDPMHSWWESISKARSRIQSLSSLLDPSLSQSLSSLADSDRPALSLLSSLQSYDAVSSALSSPLCGSGSDPLCHWLYDTFLSSDPHLRLVVFSFLPLLSGLYLSRVHSLSSDSPSLPSLAGFEAVLLAIYAAETKARNGKPVVVSIPDLSQPSLYHTPLLQKPNPLTASTAPHQSIGVLSPPLEPQVAVKSTKRACIVGVALDSYYKHISQMPTWSKIDFCRFLASWAGQDCSCLRQFGDDDTNEPDMNPGLFLEGSDEIDVVTEEMDQLTVRIEKPGSNGVHLEPKGSRIPLPWELLQPALRILGHCLLAPLNSQDVKDAASVAVRRLYARASHDLVPQAILATQSLIQLDKRTREAAKTVAATNSSSNANTPSKAKKPEVFLVSK